MINYILIGFIGFRICSCIYSFFKKDYLRSEVDMLWIIVITNVIGV